MLHLSVNLLSEYVLHVREFILEILLQVISEVIARPDIFKIFIGA
jgi:hypothetical protein